MQSLAKSGLDSMVTCNAAISGHVRVRRVGAGWGQGRGEEEDHWRLEDGAHLPTTSFVVGCTRRKKKSSF